MNIKQKKQLTLNSENKANIAGIYIFHNSNIIFFNLSINNKIKDNKVKKDTKNPVSLKIQFSLQSYLLPKKENININPIINKTILSIFFINTYPHYNHLSIQLVNHHLHLY